MFKIRFIEKIAGKMEKEAITEAERAGAANDLINKRLKYVKLMEATRNNTIGESVGAKTNKNLNNNHLYLPKVNKIIKAV